MDILRHTRAGSFIAACRTFIPGLDLPRSINRYHFWQGENMKTRSIVLTMLLCAFGFALAFAADNPNMGTWKLNEAKSKIPDGVTKNTTVVYAAEGDNVKVTT